MAIKKSIELPSGIIVEYHVVSMVLDRVPDIMTIRIDSWKDKDARDSGKQPVRIGRNFFIPKEVWGNEYANGDNFVSKVYSFIVAGNTGIEYLDEYAEGIEE